MRRLAPLALAAAVLAGCVSVEGLPDPKGALKPGQRLVMAVYPSPGPWIIDAADTKAEAAAKISPVGFLMSGLQDQHTLSVSKNLEQYMPRPHYGLEVHDALLKTLQAKAPSAKVQDAVEGGIVPAQLMDWNKAKDQLDWRMRYYAPDPDAPAPRDYARILTLDDALVLDVNVSYGTIATDDGRILPEMSAASRVYRGDTSRLIWEHEDEVTDATSSSTLSEFKVNPADLTARVEKLAPRLADAVAASFAKAFYGIPVPSTGPVAGSSSAYAGAPSGGLVPTGFFGGAPGVGTTGGLVPASAFASTSPATAPTAAPPATWGPPPGAFSAPPPGYAAPPAVSSSTAAAPPATSTTTAAAPPSVSSAAYAAPPEASTAAYAAPPAVFVSSGMTVEGVIPVTSSTDTAPSPKP